MAHNIIVVLPNQIKGRELINLITEIAQQVFGDISIKAKSYGGYVPGPKREKFVGSEITITFSLTKEQKVNSFWSNTGYKILRQTQVFNMRLGTPIAVDYLYNVVSFVVFTEWHGEGVTKVSEININQENYDFLRDKFEEFLIVLYSRLAPEEAQQPTESQAESIVTESITPLDTPIL